MVETLNAKEIEYDYIICFSDNVFSSELESVCHRLSLSVCIQNFGNFLVRTRTLSLVFTPFRHIDHVLKLSKKQISTIYFLWLKNFLVNKEKVC